MCNHHKSSIRSDGARIFTPLPLLSAKLAFGEDRLAAAGLRYFRAHPDGSAARLIQTTATGLAVLNGTGDAFEQVIKGT